jgi:hypothetical protein
VALDRQGRRVPLPARRFECGLSHRRGRLGRGNLRLHDRDERRLVARLAETRRLPHEQAGLPRRQIHVGDQVLHVLDLRERGAVWVAAVTGMGSRRGGGSRRDPDVDGRKADEEERRHRVEDEADRFAGHADQVLGAERDVVQFERDARIPGHAESAPRAVRVHAGAVAREKIGVGGTFGLPLDEHQISVGVSPGGDEALASRELDAAVRACRLQLRRIEVSARPALAEREGPEGRPGRHLL